MMWRSPRPRLWEEVKVKYKKKKYLPHPWVSSVFLPTSHLSKLRKPQVLHTSSYFTYRQWLRFTKKKKKGCLPPPSCHSLVLLAFLCGRWPPSLCCGSLAPRPPHPSLHFHCGSYSRAYDTKTLKQMNTLLLCYTTLLKSSVFAKIICKYFRWLAGDGQENLRWLRKNLVFPVPALVHVWAAAILAPPQMILLDSMHEDTHPNTTLLPAPPFDSQFVCTAQSEPVNNGLKIFLK